MAKAAAKARTKVKPARKPTPKAKATPKAKPAPVAPGSVFAAQVYDGRWTAFVVVSNNGKSLAIAALDVLGDAPPTLDDVRDAPLLRPTHHMWNGGVAYVNVSASQPPHRWRLLGVIAPPALGACNSYGGWPDGFAQVVLQRRWETEVPEAARAAYKAAPRSPSRLVIGTSDAPLAPAAPFDWDALDVAHLTDLVVYGDPAGLVDFLRANPLIDTLSWNSHGREHLDLSSTRLSDVAIHVCRRCTVALPETVRLLTARADIGVLEVDQALRGERMALVMQRTAAPPRGLDRLRLLRVSPPPSDGLDLEPLVEAFPALEDLTVYGPATPLAHIERLAALSRLRKLDLDGCYRLDVAALPPASTWPQLEHVLIAGHRKADAGALRERLGDAPRFELSNGRTDDWLAANLDNPCNEWIEHDHRAGRKAAAAWRKARAALSPPPAKKVAEAVLRAFVDAINQLHAKKGLATIDRKDIEKAFHALSGVAGLDAATARRWLGTWRAF